MSTQYDVVIAKLRTELDVVSMSDGVALRAALKRALQGLDAVTRKTLQPGTFVTFKTSKVPEAIVGRIVKVNPKNVSVAVVQPVGRFGEMWRVSPSLLSECDAPDLPAVDGDRAAEIARALCAEARFGPDECDARHLTENAGTHLLFVSTPAHGYFVTVSSDGVGRVVGEEDCGIPDARLRRFFGIGQYAEEVMDWVSGVPESSAARRAEV